MIGLISINDLKDFLFERDSLSPVLIAGDLLNRRYESLTVEDNCFTAMQKMTKYQLEGLPVIENLNNKKLIGMIWRKDIQDAYQKEINRIEITSSLASSISMKEDEKNVQFIEGYSVAEVRVPKSFIGKSISEINIRVNYNVNVLSIKTSIKRRSKINAVPKPDYVFKDNDILVVAGEIKSINQLKSID